MYKLYPMNICLFIFLFHFVSNKERFFVKINDIDYEFNLNTAEDGMSFYKELKEKKTIKLKDFKFNNSLFFSGIISFTSNLKFISDQEYIPKKGEIIIFGLFDYFLSIFINETQKFSDLDINSFVRVGNIIPSKEFNTLVSSINENEAQSFVSEIRIEEEDDTPKKMEKSGNWKTVKLMKRVKALKRYRIVKRLEKLKRLKKL